MTGSAPDVAETFLAFRVWRYHAPGKTLLSLNSPTRKASWVATALADPAGGWPQDGGLGGYPAPLTATCSQANKPPRRVREGEKPEPPHGPIPGKKCTCGIYATTDLGVIDDYLGGDAPVLGLVELGGRVIPARQGYRAAIGRVAAILLLDESLTLPHPVLSEIAAAYRVPALVPHSRNPKDYRDRLATARSLGDEAEEWLAGMGGKES
jgi:hypothetical protein